jgi:hypothetical protein
MSREEIDEAINALNELFSEKKFSNSAVLNALSRMSVHLAFVFGISKDVYIKDISIMFDERVKRAVEESGATNE